MTEKLQLSPEHIELRLTIAKQLMEIEPQLNLKEAKKKATKMIVAFAKAQKAQGEIK